ncbi:MAG: hypothetical protein IPN29_03280 [Saprospiraceae bacterium]|nr:hypothetical protein [Saprospiraceae bacterium]
MRYPEKTFLQVLIFSGLLVACGQSGQQTGTQSLPQVDSITLLENQAESANVARLDSIEKANSESVLASGDDGTKAYINKQDSTISLFANIRKDHRIIGYSKPDIHSDRLLMISVFTSDVENNPFSRQLGAYYDTSGMEDMLLKYQGTKGDFIEVLALGHGSIETTMYMEKKWVEFE